MQLSLRRYLTVAFTLIATVPVLILGLWVEKTSMDKELAGVEEKHLLLATNTTAALERYAEDARAVFGLFTDPDELSPTAARLALARKIGFRHIAHYDTSGQSTAQMAVDGRPPQVLPAAILDRLRAGQIPGETHFSNVMADDEGRPTLYLVLGLESGDMAVGALKLDYIRQMQSAISFGRRGHSAIVDRTGTIIAHPRPDWQRQMKNIAQVKPVEQMMAGGAGVTRFFSPAIESDMITGYSTVPGTGWGVMVPQPLDELEERAGDVKQMAFGLILVGLVVAALLSWALAGLLVRPLQAIVKASRTFARGRLDAQVQALPSGYPSEYRELGSSFNFMIREIADGIMEREEASSELRITADQLDRVNNRLKNRNMTLQHQVSERARENQALLQAVVDTVPGMLAAKDLNLRYQFMNRYQADIYGTTPAQAIGKTAGDFIAGAYGNKTERLDREVIRTGAPLPPFEETYADASGQTHTWLTAKTPFKDENGDVKYIVTSAIDITDRKQLERMKGEFISTVSHELRTPLTIVNGALGLLRHLHGGQLSEEVAGMVEIAQSNTDRLAELADNILDMQLLEADQLPFDFQTVDLSALVTASIGRNRDLALSHDVIFEAGKIEENIKVRADRHRIGQVLGNLLSNAAKFSPKGKTVTVSVDCQDRLARVSVSDRGKGIPPEYNGKVFDRFAQVDSSDARETGGTGLGLSISKAIIEKHGGEIGFRSAVGRGSEFYFTLPLAG